MQLSIVVPVYNEEESLEQLLADIHAALDGSSIDYEIVCIDDGSTDGTRALLESAAERDRRLVVGLFRRNFGQTAAMQAGITAARGEVIVTMDADLQNDPSDIPRMLDKLAEGYDLVAGWRADRKDRLFDRRLPSMLANWLISATTRVRLHDYGCTLKAMRADLAQELRLYGEMHRFIPVMASLVGARIVELPVNHRARRFGRSKYGIGRTLRVLLDLVTVLFLRSYLVRPMQVFGLAGLCSTALGAGIGAYLSYEKLAHGASLANRPLLLLSVMLVLVGVQLLSLGLVADVVGRTYHEAQGRPAYHVRKWIGRAAPNSMRTNSDSPRPSHGGPGASG
jgi:glycosyltransferase involved in cell wall biosynthesis